MFLTTNTFRLTASLSLLLALAVAVTGFVSSVYRREKQALGEKHYQSGQQLQQQSKLPAAVEQYREALLFSPDKVEYRVSFVAALIQSGQLGEAESHLDQLLQEDPTNGVLNLMRARLAVRRNAVPKAIDYYRRAVYEYWPPSQANERRQARWELIDLLERKGRREDAVGELMTLYANAPADAKLRAKVGFELLDNGATSEAMQVFRDLTRASQHDSQAHRGLGEAYFASGDFISARHEYERALRYNPKDRKVSESLSFTNAIIDLDPELSGLPSAERFRRSQNLLRRVLGDLGGCSVPEGQKAQLDAAAQLLQSPPQNDPDWALQLQKTAKQLWAARSQICGAKPTDDTVLATVFERILNG
ncbi:MAG: tetratricopeptide repeat protein [Acidobacteriaceae bacterium]|nr:tetratricopeptide repeat protein [Acidobacteriaceae bacterium]